MTAGRPDSGVEPHPSVLTVANLVYGLHAFAILVGLAGSATVVGSFVGSLPSILAVVLNYAKRGEARGTWLESHYRWQIRTFWYAFAWLLGALVLFLTLVGIPAALAVLLALSAWLVYRIARGWLRLRDRLPMYTDR
jgi:uncharacterized membrane protein